MIKIIVADDHAVVRTGLQLILDNPPVMQIVDEAKNGDELTRKVLQNHYDVAILDILMPGQNVFSTLDKLAEYKVPVIIFTMNQEKSMIIRMFKKGVNAYINKGMNPTILSNAIESAASGKKYYTPEQKDLLMDYYIDNPHPEKMLFENLTEREFQIMGLLAAGISKDQIIASLSISKNTLNNHRSNILKKLGIRNNAELTKLAIQHGYIR